MNEIKYEKAAQIISVEQLIDISSLERHKAMQAHFMAKDMIDVLGLPYRILLNYFKQHGCSYLHANTAATDGDVVLINPNYPYPGYERSKLTPIDIDDVVIDKQLNMYIKDEQRRIEIAAKAAGARPWNIYDDRWQYECAHWLNADSMRYFCEFDWFGEKKPPNVGELKRQQKLIKFWKNLSEKYKAAPDHYRQTEPSIHDYDISQYTQYEFDIINIGCSYAEL